MENGYLYPLSWEEAPRAIMIFISGVPPLIMSPTKYMSPWTYQNGYLGSDVQTRSEDRDVKQVASLGFSDQTWRDEVVNSILKT